MTIQLTQLQHFKKRKINYYLLGLSSFGISSNVEDYDLTLLGTKVTQVSVQAALNRWICQMLY